MQKEEIFRIFDACQPTVTEVKEYLERISSNSPFDLIFVKDGKETFTKKIARNMGELVGIVVGTTIFYAKPMTFDDVKDKDIVSTDIVFAFGQKIHPKAFPLNEKAIKILQENRHIFLQIAEMLEFSRYPDPYSQKQYLLLDQNDNKTDGLFFDFESNIQNFTDIAHFLKNYGNIYFYASL